MAHCAPARFLVRPAEQHGDDQDKDRTVIEREQRVIDALGGRKLPAHVLLDEIHQRDDEFGAEDGQNDHSERAVGFEPSEHHEQKGIEQIAHAMQEQFAPLRRAPCQSLR